MFWVGIIVIFLYNYILVYKTNCKIIKGKIILTIILVYIACVYHMWMWDVYT